MWLLNDLSASSGASSGAAQCRGFSSLDRIRARSSAYLDANRAAYNRFVATRDDLEALPLEFAPLVFHG